MSRSTVREALRLLASQNLIVTTRGVAGGSFVVHPSPDQLIDTLATGVNLLLTSQLVSTADLLEARLFVELPAAAMVASRRSDEDLRAMREALFDPRTTDFEIMAAVHTEFHEAMADACGNPLLTLVAKPLHRITNAREVLLRFGREFWIQVDADHRAILAAVTASQPEEAQAATARHIENLAKAFETPDEPGTASSASPDAESGPNAQSEPDVAPAAESVSGPGAQPSGGSSADSLVVSGAGGA